MVVSSNPVAIIHRYMFLVTYINLVASAVLKNKSNKRIVFSSVCTNQIIHIAMCNGKLKN